MSNNSTVPWESLAKLCLSYAEAKAGLEHASETIRADQRAAARKGLGELRRHSGALTKASERLRAAVSQAVQQGMFAKPRTRVFEGVRIGIKKHPDSLEVSDEAKAIGLIRQHLTEEADRLIRTRESLDKAALKSLDPAELRKIGVKLVAGEDEIIAGTSGADALAASLLADAEAAS